MISVAECSKGWLAWRTPKGVVDIADWMLVPSTLPPMEAKSAAFCYRKKDKWNNDSGWISFNSKSNNNSGKHSCFILLDQSFYTNGYPELDFSKGKDAGILLTYAEALFTEKPDGPGKTFKKGNRNEVEGKIIAGRKDSIISNGKDDQYFSTLNWRTFRMLKLK
jgi:hypothetical protein